MEIIKFLIILLVLITVHEFGHFIVAKIFNVYVSEFALGFGPKIFSYKGKETEFTIRLLPLGGYAAMVGEDGEISEDLAHVPHERTLKGVNRFKQFLIMFAGSFMNLLLAFIIFCGIAFSQDTVSTDPIIGDITTNSPAMKAGLQSGDYVKEIRQGDEVTKINSYTDLTLFSSYNTEGNEYEMVVERENKEEVIKIKPTYDDTSKRYIAGFGPTIVKASHNPIDVVKNGWKLSVDTAQNIFTSLKMLFTGKAGVDDLSGPVGMVDITRQISQNSGLIGLINFTALLSINLAIFNLLPIPALDGGRIFILAIEAITRRRMSEKLEARIIGISFMLLMALIVFVTFNDIMKIFTR
ncbi:regulator of sigma E protease [Bacilli bacterium PM5-3]|nr:regulator of sigma E protease [Bacilli bacterium PM5-3]MDH6603144.1 regulator of sigma E protease [Bacilli bacterium PM5-9]